MIFLHYDEATGDFKGWFDDRITNPIPTPNIQMDPKDHLKYLNAVNHEQKALKIVNGKVTVVKPTIVLDWDGVRFERNQLLNSTDWTQVSDVPADLKAKYAVYRQALRDLPETYTKAENVRWPKKPS